MVPSFFRGLLFPFLETDAGHFLSINKLEIVRLFRKGNVGPLKKKELRNHYLSPCRLANLNSILSGRLFSLLLCVFEEKRNDRPRKKERLAYETTWRCQKNPFIGALGIQEPVIPSEPLFKG